MTITPTSISTTGAAPRAGIEPDPGGRTTRLARSAGAAWLAGGVLWLAAGLLHDGTGWRFDAASWLWLVADVCLAAGLVALFALRPHGTSRLGAAALAAAVVARGAFAGGEVLSLLDGHDDNPLIPLGALLTAVGMTAYGVVVLARGVLAGPARWCFLAVGLFPFVAMFPVVAVTGEPATVLIALWGVPMALVGPALAGGRSAG